MARKKLTGKPGASGRSDDVEIAVMRQVHNALNRLQDSEAQQRVIDYVMKRLSLQGESSGTALRREHFRDQDQEQDRESESSTAASSRRTQDDDAGQLEGMSAIAQKWVKRNGISEAQLGHIFTLGLEDIDVVAKSVPGKSIKDRLRNVALLQGTAAYLGTGVARMKYEKLRESARHYKALDTNFAANMKKLNSDVSGSQTSGYTLTNRGLSEAGDLIKAMAESLAPKK